MTRAWALVSIWVGALTVWWVVIPLVVIALVGISDWFDTGRFTTSLRDYAVPVLFFEGFRSEHSVLLAIASFAATLQLMLVAPAVPPYKAAQEGRSMVMSIVAASIVAGALVTALAFASIEALLVWLRSDGSLPFDEPQWLVAASIMTWLVTSAVWTTVLWRVGAAARPDQVSRLVHAALRGSALQVVLGLPLYIIVRRREDCWCSLMTFWSLCIGLASLILLCGPGAVLLLTRGSRRAWRQGACSACGHLRAPSSRQCPECGALYI